MVILLFTRFYGGGGAYFDNFLFLALLTGYTEIAGGLLDEVDCLILHDVDLLPVGVNTYSCTINHPTHMYVY